MNHKSVCSLSPTNSYIYSAGKETVFLHLIFLVISEHFFYIRTTHFYLSRDLALRPGLGAGDLPGAFIVRRGGHCKVRTRGQPSIF